MKYESAAVDEKIIYQECLCGQEYGVDIINNLEGNFENAIVKKKIAMRAGETDIARIEENREIYNECKRLSSLTKHIANMDTDVFLVDGKPYILEMNARFGGGYPFSHMGGCNLPKAIVEWSKGMTTSKEMLEAKVGTKAFKELSLTIV